VRVGLVGKVYVALLPNCEECGAPLLTLGRDGVSIMDRRELGICANCELPKTWRRLKSAVTDPYGQPEKEGVQ
jgi:hypothetical protein